MIASIHQPNYIPWLGYFYKIYKSDVFVILDDIKYIKNSYINRNKIKTPQGSMWLTIPVVYKADLKLKINEVITKDELNWNEKHLKNIEMNYKKTKYFYDFYEVFRDLLLKDYKTICDLNIAIIKKICEVLNIDTEIKLSSELKVDGKSTERLINICKITGTDTYLSGKGGKKYQDEELFRKNNIKLMYSDYNEKKYEQLWGDFLKKMSILDFIFNTGFDIKRIFE